MKIKTILQQYNTPEKLMHFLDNANNVYRSGDAIIDDVTYDSLLMYCKSISMDANSISKLHFDTDTSNKLSPHWAPMLSLADMHIDDDFTYNKLNKVTNFLSHSLSDYCMSYKLDGGAINIQYIKGNLYKILTRGNDGGNNGFDITYKFRDKVPQTLTQPLTIEVRGEAVIAKDMFAKHYSKEHGTGKYENERNMVTGIMNSNDTKHTEHIDIVCYTIVSFTNIKQQQFNGTIHDFALLQQYGFGLHQLLNTITCKHSLIQNAYKVLLHGRAQFKYRVDGTVLKSHGNMQHYRNSIDYLNAIALKFSAIKTIAKVIDIHWSQKIDGSFFPVAIIKPVRLDGTTVKRASVFNYEWLLSKGIGIGSAILLEKGGDIIPNVHSVITKSDNIPMPANDCYQKGKHLYSKTHETDYIRFIRGAMSLNLANVGGVQIHQLYESNYHTIYDLFSLTLQDLLDKGWQNNATTQNLAVQINNRLSSIWLEHLLFCLRIPQAGRAICAQVALQISDQSYSMKGLNKRAYFNLIANTQLQKILKEYEDSIVFAPYVKETTQISAAIQYVLTKSPKSAGIATKAQFKTMLPQDWQEVSKLTDANLLITDSLDSNSNKMKFAKEHNIKIATYTDIISDLHTNK
jgi:NAD-dependent DNA ligase